MMDRKFHDTQPQTMMRSKGHQSGHVRLRARMYSNTHVNLLLLLNAC